ncbi:methyltransferase domain-containing protein [Ancylobacter sp. 6x-1]|uniref:Methyltransferase domain-containing protein n=1 Tax=Ancylobacter crimeensis TaxID=2579147 RepID=A0ABT0DEW3_9HYPH|nr:RsmB/NOP family class I SAM-dependent RNA methyltransferase [Ancylobacter crimeensis]MCK0198490.1 methyltransferase domain-containing protein [Ancylobacter crimeensis]
MTKSNDGNRHPPAGGRGTGKTPGNRGGKPSRGAQRGAVTGGSEPSAGESAGGLGARRAAADAIDAVLVNGRPLEEALERLTRDLDERDRGLARMIAASVLRRLGSLRAAIGACLESPLPERGRRAETLLLVGAAQILLMDVPDHAAVGTSVTLAAEQPASAGYKGLINAVLRRLTREGRALLEAPGGAHPDLAPDLPDWLMAGWSRAYGAEAAARAAAMLGTEAPLDISVKADGEGWAEKLGGRLLPTGSIRLVGAGNITALPGFSDGAWWVQDAAAALPARLMRAGTGMRVADLCAAPGGKTAQLAATGAHVTALDRSGSRLKRLSQNLARLGLEAEVVEADAAAWQAAQPFDAVLIDAPCSATGTIRRHPDVAWTKGPRDVASLAGLQARLLDHAATLVRPGGCLVYSTCSLEPEEGEQQVARLLAASDAFERDPVLPGESGIAAEWLTAAGEVRTLPYHLPDPDPRYAGLDGFFAARLRRRG